MNLFLVGPHSDYGDIVIVGIVRVKDKQVLGAVVTQNQFCRFEIQACKRIGLLIGGRVCVCFPIFRQVRDDLLDRQRQLEELLFFEPNRRRTAFAVDDDSESAIAWLSDGLGSQAGYVGKFVLCFCHDCSVNSSRSAME